jgi:hypothetical protein
MEEGFFSIQRALEIIRVDLISIARNVVWVGQAIGAIGALIYIAKLSYEGMLGGNLLSLAMLRPFALALMLALYPQFMLMVDGIAMAVNIGLGRAMITEEHRISDILKTRDLNPETDTDENLIGIEDIYSEEGEEESALVDRLTDAVTTSLNVFKWVGEKFYYAMMRFLEEVLFRVSHAVLIIVNSLRVFFLVVLYICGPLVIGISNFPGFEGVYFRWFARYLSVHLWLGIGNIFEAIALRLWGIIVENGGFWTQGLGLEESVDSVILTTWAWVFLLVLIVGYVTIPIVAGWVISGSGIGQAGALLSAGGVKGIIKAGKEAVR